MLTSATAFSLLKPYFEGESGAYLFSLLQEDDVLAISSMLYHEISSEKSFYKPYLLSLPPASDLAAVVGAGTWSSTELDWFRDSSMFRQGETRTGEVLACYSALQAAGIKGHGVEAWRWCVACVTSRVFLSGMGADPLFMGGMGAISMLDLALVPGGDLFNHSGPLGTNIMDTDWENDSYEVRCPLGEKSTPKKGEELFISYGDRSSRDLCENYGFCPSPPALGDSLTLPIASLLGPFLSDVSAKKEGDDSGESRRGSSSCLSDHDTAFWGKLSRCVMEGSAGLPGKDDCDAAACPPKSITISLRASLLERYTGLPLNSLEVELPTPGGDLLPAECLPVDSIRALRALCLSPKDVIVKRSGADAVGGDNYSMDYMLRCCFPLERLERPLSRDNEVRVHALLALLLGGTMVEGWCSRRDTSLNATTVPPHPTASSTTHVGMDSKGFFAYLGIDGIPRMTHSAKEKMELLFSTMVDAFAQHTPHSVASDEGKVGACEKTLTAFSTSGVLATDFLVRVGEALLELEKGCTEGLARIENASISCEQEGSTESSREEPWCTFNGVFSLRRSKFFLASRYRASRIHTLLSYARYSSSMLLVGSGGPPAGGSTNACAGQRLCSLGCFPQIGLDVQIPWSAKLLSGEKSIETRSYPLPLEFLGLELAILESPEKVGLWVEGAAAFSDPLLCATQQAASVVGTVSFSASKRYVLKEEWIKDRAAHGVYEEEGVMGWKDCQEKWAWVVSRVRAFPEPVPVLVTPGQRLFRSFFALSYGVDNVWARGLFRNVIRS